MISPELLLQLFRQRPEPMTGAAGVHDDARVERVAHPLEDCAQRIVLQGKERHRGAVGMKAGKGRANSMPTVASSVARGRGRCPRSPSFSWSDRAHRAALMSTHEA